MKMKKENEYIEDLSGALKEMKKDKDVIARINASSSFEGAGKPKFYDI